ncbi:PREDICTED: uncharacterized protein LOC109483910 [Branchiostoma belcheri]|uniref:Leucine-rich repeat protein SHOC-2 n=1 Tax=Branchiostoma belcheri TaxID=7741 RepID=A0A6P5A032_BRABE|nr:PREDICTED: uncharacterized protein LOC109483910 [Branchiostoma belcheri]
MEEKEQELREAARRGDEDKVKQLLAEGVNVNAANNGAWTALHKASENGHTGTVQALLTAGAAIDARSNSLWKWTALHSASEHGHTGTVQALLTAGATVDAPDSGRRTALDHASKHGHTGTVQALLTAGATVDTRNNENETPLHAAARRGHPECVRVLLRAGANTVIRNSDKETAEDLAVQEDVQQVFQLFKALQKPEKVDGLLTIDLSDKGLTSVPAEVFDIRDVEHLVLSNNRLKSIPEEIGQLQKLQRLELDNNLLTQLPQAITTLPNLQVIDLSDNKLETLPDGFSRLKQLRDLYIQYNAFKEIPEEVWSLHLIKFLDIGGNPLKCLPDKISQLTGLTQLFINDCQFDEFPRQVLQLEGLKKLHLGNWAGEGKPSLVPEDIGRLKNLQILGLQNSGLESLPECVGELVQLEVVDISGNRFTSVPEQIMNLSNIRKLHLSDNRISRLPLTLSRMARLVEMNIEDNPLTYPPPDVCKKGTAVIMDFLRREKGIELGKLFFLFSQNVTQRVEVEALAAVAGLTANERTNILGKDINWTCQANNVLLKWIEKDREASMDKLQRVLRECGMNQLADKADRLEAQPVKRPADTSGRPPAKRPAAGGSSGEGHQEDKLAQLRGGQKSRSQDGAEHPEVTSVLMVNNEYGESHRGSSTTNRQVAQFLQQRGATVHATALQASEDDKKCAKEDGVILHLPVRHPRDLRPPCPDWLTFDHIIRYPDIPQDLKCIVGHANVTSGAAKSIQENHREEAKLVIFNHDIPEETEYYKGAEKALAAGKKTEDILEDTKNADAVFSLGKRVYDYFEMKYMSLGESKPGQHFLFLPRPSPVFEAISIRPGGGQKVVLSVGRVTKVDKLKGHDLVARALGEVAEKITNVSLRVRGIDENDWEASKRILEENLHSGKIKPTLLPYGTQKDIAEDMQQAHLVLMPSRAEPFGLIGLEAIAAGIPVLISDKSGLADMIKDLIKEKKCPAEMRHRIVETSVRESDLGEDAREWAKKITDTLEYSEEEFKKAAEYKKKLLESKYWEESHQNLLRVCGLNKDE